MNDANAPPGSGRLFYVIQPRDDGCVDVYLMPFRGVTLVVRGVAPWDGMEDDIRARYYAWCESAEMTKIERRQEHEHRDQIGERGHAEREADGFGV